MTARSLALFAVLLLVTRVAAAGPDVLLHAATGALPLELVRDGNSWIGELRLENRGPVAIDVRVAPRAGGELLPRLPPTVSAAFAGAKSIAHLEPGQSQTIAVRWAPGRGRRPRELYGQVEVEIAGARRVVAGFHADSQPSALGGRPLSALLALPLLGLVALGVLARWRRAAERLWIAVASVGAAQLALALAIHAAFVPGLNRYDGNDGFQFVERSVLERGLGIEYALGVDGLSLGLVALAAFAITACALLGTPRRMRLASHWAFVLTIDLGVIGALIATDLALVLAFWWLALLGSATLILAAGDREARSAGARFAAFSALAFSLVTLTCLWVAQRAGASYLVDGAETRRTFSIPELSHADLGGHALVIPYVVLVLGLGALMGLAPLNAWLSETTARVSASLGLLVNLGTATIAAYLLLRIGYGVLPRGTAWAAPALAALAVLSVLWSGFTSAHHGELRRLAAVAGAINLGVALLSFSALTAIGVAGCVVGIQTHTLSMVLWFGFIASLEHPTGGAELDRVESGLTAAPLLFPVAAVTYLSLLAGPGSIGFVARVLAIFGAAPLEPLAAAAMAFGLIAIAFFQRQGWREARQNTAVEPELTPYAPSTRQRAVLIASALVIVVTGVWPAPAFSVIAESALDHAARVNPPGPLEIVEEPPRRSAPDPALARALLHFPRERGADRGLSDSRADR